MKKKKLIILVVFITLSSFLNFSFINISTGMHKDSLVIDRLKRTFLNMVKLTMEGFNTLSERSGFIVVYPEGIDNHWNDGRNSEEPGAKKGNIDDVGFISALIDFLVIKLNADQNRVFVTGMSNGAIMSYRLACELSEKIAAIAPVAGNIPQNILLKCSPSHPVSVLAINGTKDPLVPFNGGDVTGPFGQKKLGKVLPVRESVRFWVNFNNCSATPVVTYEPNSDIEDETLVRKEVYTNGRKSSEVVLYIIENGGHTWPGGNQYLGKGIVGKTCYDINADEIIWKFFENHSLK